MWLVYALAASIIWGMLYIISQKIFERQISPIALMCLETLFGGIVFATAALLGYLRHDLARLINEPDLRRLASASILLFLIGNFLIAQSVAAKNTTLAGMVEISYPIFITLFAWLIFGENQLTASVMAGSLFIFIGIFIIYRFS